MPFADVCRQLGPKAGSHSLVQMVRSHCFAVATADSADSTDSAAATVADSAVSAATAATAVTADSAAGVATDITAAMQSTFMGAVTSWASFGSSQGSFRGYCY